jgi:hypothetical protein
MRYIIADSFDKREVNRTFDADVVPRIGSVVRSKKGHVYRITDIVWYPDPFDRRQNVRALLRREA